MNKYKEKLIAEIQSINKSIEISKIFMYECKEKRNISFKMIDDIKALIIMVELETNIIETLNDKIKVLLSDIELYDSRIKKKKNLLKKNLLICNISAIIYVLIRMKKQCSIILIIIQVSIIINVYYVVHYFNMLSLANQNCLLEEITKQLQENLFEIEYIKILHDSYDMVVPLVLKDKEYHSSIIKWKYKNRTFYYVLKPTIRIEKIGSWPFSENVECVYYEESLDDIINLIKKESICF